MQSALSLKTKSALAIAIILWASAFVGIRAGLQSYSPGALALLRFLVASICMFFIYRRLPNRTPMSPQHIIGALAVGAFGVGFYNIALNCGETSTPAGVASFIIGLSPIITIIFAVIFLGERLTLKGISGLIISLIGMMLIMLSEDHLVTFNKGLFYLLCAALVSGAYSVLQKPLLKNYHAIQVTAYAIWGSTLVLLFFFPDLAHEFNRAPPHATYAIIYLGIFPAAIAYIAWSYALAEMPAARAVNFLYFMPLVATLMGWFWLGEIPALLACVGGIIALSGVWILNKSFHHKVAP